MAAAPSPGVLALQGGVEGHLGALDRLGTDPRPVRSVGDLEGLTHLVLPGGESTTLRHLMDLFGLSQAIVSRHRAGSLAILGTCAGAILLGRSNGEPPERLGLLDAVVERNAYGRQVDSFISPLRLPEWTTELDGVFIRAPKFRDIGSGARAIGWNGDEPVLIEGPGLLAATFHPELTGSLAVHEYFLRCG